MMLFVRTKVGQSWYYVHSFTQTKTPILLPSFKKALTFQTETEANNIIEWIKESAVYSKDLVFEIMPL